jgi:hypothetical protein
MYEIEKGIPLPREGESKTKYPFRAMVPGDSFSFPKEQIGAVRQSASNFNRSSKAYRIAVRMTAQGDLRAFCADK